MKHNFIILISGGVGFAGGIRIIYQANYEGSLDFYLGIYSMIIGLLFIFKAILGEIKF